MFDHRSDQRFEASCYLISPESIHTVEEAAKWGKRAEEGAQRARELIAQLEAYQTLLYARVQQLSQATYHREVHLLRTWNYCSHKVEYYLTVYQYSDDPGIDRQVIERTKYPGTERRQAIKDFEAYQKSHPGIIAVKDIEKSKWER